MDASLATGDLALLIAALMVGGLVMGTLAGLLGVGGGGLLVPILYDLFAFLGVPDEHRMHYAVGTTMAVIIPTSFRSFRSHYKRGAADMAVIRKLGPPVALGVVAGVFIAGYSQAEVLKTVYVISCALMAFNLFAANDKWRLGADLPGEPGNFLVGILIGVVSTLIGIGGGVYVSNYMTLFGRKIHQAVATSSGFGPIIAIPAVAGYIWAGWGVEGLPPGSVGYVSLLGFAIVTPMSVLAAPLGVRIAHGISRRKLEIAFALFLTTVAIRFLYSLIVG